MTKQISGSQSLHAFQKVEARDNQESPNVGKEGKLPLRRPSFGPRELHVDIPMSPPKNPGYSHRFPDDSLRESPDLWSGTNSDGSPRLKITMADVTQSMLDSAFAKNAELHVTVSPGGSSQSSPLVLGSPWKQMDTTHDRQVDTPYPNFAASRSIPPRDKSPDSPYLPHVSELTEPLNIDYGKIEMVFKPVEDMTDHEAKTMVKLLEGHTFQLDLQALFKMEALAQDSDVNVYDVLQVVKRDKL